MTQCLNSEKIMKVQLLSLFILRSLSLSLSLSLTHTHTHTFLSLSLFPPLSLSQYLTLSLTSLRKPSLYPLSLSLFGIRKGHKQMRINFSSTFISLPLHFLTKRPPKSKRQKFHYKQEYKTGLKQVLQLFPYKSFSQAWTVILIELSINFPGINLLVY